MKIAESLANTGLCQIVIKCILKTETLALMEAASFCAGVRNKRYSGQQE